MTNLDLAEMRVDLKRFEGDYYTKPIGFKELTILDGEPLQREAPHAERPLLCIYDGYQGGVGYARQAYQQFFRLAAATLDHLKHCQCLSGCPACIQSPRCGSGNDDLDKEGAVILLQAFLMPEEHPPLAV